MVSGKEEREIGGNKIENWSRLCDPKIVVFLFSPSRIPAPPLPLGGFYFNFFSVASLVPSRLWCKMRCKLVVSVCVRVDILPIYSMRRLEAVRVSSNLSTFVVVVVTESGCELSILPLPPPPSRQCRRLNETASRMEVCVIVILLMRWHSRRMYVEDCAVDYINI